MADDLPRVGRYRRTKSATLSAWRYSMTSQSGVVLTLTMPGNGRNHCLSCPARARVVGHHAQGTPSSVMLLTQSRPTSGVVRVDPVFIVMPFKEPFGFVSKTALIFAAIG